MGDSGRSLFELRVVQSYVCGPKMVPWWPGPWTSWLLGTAPGRALQWGGAREDWRDPVEARSGPQEWLNWLQMVNDWEITSYLW